MTRSIGWTRAAALVMGFAATALAGPKTLVVTQASVTYPHYTSIQDAVNHAAPGDWVLIDAGTYNEAVYVVTPNIHIRGIDRNAVVLDGQHQVGNGIEVWKANGVSIENLTVHDFDRPDVDGADGNEIWWNGGDGSGAIGMQHWRGSYLTTYDTGLKGGYGIFISNAEHGRLDHAYASGFNDSGLYLGACRDCRAKISHALVENNCLGYSGTNSGGHVIVQDSIFRNNANGVGPNSLNNDDQPPPQDGACNSKKNTSATPTFPTTHIARCTIFRRNTMSNNGNLSTPSNSTTRMIPWGNGVVLIGTYADLFEQNIITDNPNTGLLGFENPDPFPPTPDTVYFQLSGNKIYKNFFGNNGGHGETPSPYDGDITIEGGLFGSMMSVNNCVSKNTLTSSYPANIQTVLGCENLTTPNGGVDPLSRIIELLGQSEARTSQAQPAPLAQLTMPNPCGGPPANPLCP
jgi:hypothetical protein